MLFPDKSSMSLNERQGYAEQAVEAMRIIHDSFSLMAEKLEAALHKQIITQQEYDEWLRCFSTLKKDWLSREVNTVEDVRFLQWMAGNSLEKAGRFAVAGFRP